MPCWIGALGVALMVSGSPAAAKTIGMPSYSRAAVDQACGRAGGRSFGLYEEGAVYGCISRQGRVECAPDGTCTGYVSDLLPLPASSLDAVLGGGPHSGPIKIGATDRRISPVQ
jgi:hypothetical protein